MVLHEPQSVELSSFVGRGRLLEQLARLLDPGAANPSRLLSLIGPGGSGKTRLALRVLETLGHLYPDGACFVALGSIADSRLVLPSIANTVGVRDAGGSSALASLKTYLRDRRMLLVLDNFEQVLGAAADLPELVVACPALQLVVTSRASLRISGEREIAVDPLETHEAVDLFNDRATAVNASFEVTCESQLLVADICQQLDGLPLAIELAAARVRVLDLPALLARLNHRLQFLTGGRRDLPARQQTLRSTIAWSYELLEPREQQVFRAAAVFAGGCTLEALEAVVADSSDPIDIVETLVARSLVRVSPTPNGGTRFRLLETTREFGLEQLAWAGELEPVRRRHAEFFCALAEHAEPAAWGPSADQWHTQLETEHGNLRAAMEWGLSSGTDLGSGLALRTAGALGRFWWTRTYFAEGLEWLARSLAASREASPERMKALHAAGWLAHFQHDSSTARAYLDESLSIAQQRGDRWTEAWVTCVLGRLAYFDSDAIRTRAHAKRTLALAEELNDQWLVAWAFHLLGLAAHVENDYAGADQLYARSLVIREGLGHVEMIGVLNQLMGMSAQRQGDVPRSREAYLRFLAMAHELHSTFHLSLALGLLGSLAAFQGQFERGAKLMGAAAVFHEASRTRPIPLTAALINEAIARATRGLGDAAFAAAWAAGRAMSSEAASAEAQAIAAAQPAVARREVSPLSDREQQVAALISRGLTNRQIAAELVVAERTVAAHIEHILDKLAFASRTQIGVWYASQSS